MRKALKPCVAETIGTFALCFIGAGSICVNAGLVGVALAHGCVLAVMISALGHISGGHFNPAVTLARAASDTFAGIRPADAPAFIIAQLLGASAATLLFRWLVPSLPQVAPEIMVPHPSAAAAEEG